MTLEEAKIVLLKWMIFITLACAACWLWWPGALGIVLFMTFFTFPEGAALLVPSTVVGFVIAGMTRVLAPEFVETGQWVLNPFINAVNSIFAAIGAMV